MDKPSLAAKKRQAVYWGLLGTIFSSPEENLRKVTAEISDELEMPPMLLDPETSVDTLTQRYPEMQAEFDQFQDFFDKEKEKNSEIGDEELRRAVVYSKMLMCIFGPKTFSGTITATQYNQWIQDVNAFEKACGFAPGTLRGKRGGGTEGGKQGSISGAQELEEGLRAMEADLIKRMALREVLKDDNLAQKLTPSMSLVEQLLHDKSNLSGKALGNAKMLIKKYVDELAEVLKLQVKQTSSGKIDRSVPPKRVFRNLDMKRTIWKNLVNWNPDEEKLYADRLYFRHTAKKTNPTRMIVLVDQSGSMVDAMVQCTILASIFAGLPKVDVHLMAFDTRVLDLTPWVHDPLEVLLRTRLGGGTYIYQALVEAMDKIVEPANTAIVLISDFFEGGSYQVLLNQIKLLKDSGVHFIPVGSLNSSGYFCVDDWFRAQLKQLGMPILSGSPKKLIEQLKELI